MHLKEFLKPSRWKVIIFLLISFLYLYVAKEKTCAVSFTFSFCYQSYGFPIYYIVTGDIDAASGITKDYLFGEYFRKTRNVLFNSLALAIDVASIYILSCFIVMLIQKIKFGKISS